MALGRSHKLTSLKKNHYQPFKILIDDSLLKSQVEKSHLRLLRNRMTEQDKK